MIMLDVDNLKRFNDTWGHAAGDDILRELGSLLLRQVRGEDIPCRSGGGDPLTRRRRLSGAWCDQYSNLESR
jgi:diguanylate cyclase (GGDEF)-like protein